ncbi:RNA-binding protein 1, partial [Fragariocoptes setiger]
MSARYKEWKIDCKVYIGNLSDGITKADIEETFNKFGPLKNVWVARNPPGFAFVEYADGHDAEAACRSLDGTRIAGNRVRVEMSHGRSRRGGGHGPPPPGPPYGGHHGGGPYHHGGGHRSSSGHFDRYIDRVPRDRHPYRPRSPPMKSYHYHSRSRSISRTPPPRSAARPRTPPSRSISPRR